MLADGRWSEGRSPKRNRPSGGASGGLLANHLGRVHVQILAFHPLLIGFHKQRRGQPQTRAVIGKNSHHARAPFQFLVLAFQHVGRAHALAMLLRQCVDGQHLFAVLFQEPRHFGRLGLELHHGRGQRRFSQLACGRFGDCFEQPRHQGPLLLAAQSERVAQKVHLAALPRHALKMPLDGPHHPLMIVAHHITDAAQSVLFQLTEDRAPTGLPRLRFFVPVDSSSSNSESLMNGQMQNRRKSPPLGG